MSGKLKNETVIPPARYIAWNLLTWIHKVGEVHFALDSYIVRNLSVGKRLNSVSSHFPIDGDSLLNMIYFLSHSDIGVFTCVSRDWAYLLSHDCMWEQLWLQRYGEFWISPQVTKIRNMRGGSLNWQGCAVHKNTSIKDTAHKDTHVSDTYKMAPTQGWKKFLLEFEACWLDWLLAGLNTRSYCLLGMNDAVYDVTDLIDNHPGSAETLLDHAGGDATMTFQEIGHSTEAVTLRDSFLLCKPTKYHPHHHDGSSGSGSGSGSSRTYIAESLSSRGKSAIKAYENLPMKIRNVLEPMSSVIGHEPCQLQVNGAEVRHHGRLRSYYDPLERDWTVWWTCCGAGTKVCTENLPWDLHI